MRVCRWVEQYGQQTYSETCSSATLPATARTWSGQVSYQSLGDNKLRQTASDKTPYQHQQIICITFKILFPSSQQTDCGSYMFRYPPPCMIIFVCWIVTQQWLIVSNFVPILKTTHWMLLKNLIAVYYLNYMQLIGKIQSCFQTLEIFWYKQQRLNFKWIVCFIL